MKSFESFGKKIKKSIVVGGLGALSMVGAPEKTEAQNTSQTCQPNNLEIAKSEPHLIKDKLVADQIEAIFKTGVESRDDSGVNTWVSCGGRGNPGVSVPIKGTHILFKKFVDGWHFDSQEDQDKFEQIGADKFLKKTKEFTK